MTSRVLDPADYGALAGTELETVWPHLPETARVVVVEDGGAIVGAWALFPVIHAEGVWIAPSHRGRASVARRLLAGMRSVVQGMGGRAVCTAARSDEVAVMLTRLGAVELPGTHFSLGVGSCQQP